MRIIAFTDIHSNYLALKEVFSKIEKEQPDQVIFLGDILAKGSDPKACFDFMMEKKVTCLAGNCDLYFVRGVDIDEDVLKDRDYYEGLNSVLDHTYKAFIESCPLKLIISHNGKKIFFAHFLMRDEAADYPYYPLSSIVSGEFDEHIKDNPYDLMVFGHSHQEFVKGNVISLGSSGLDRPSYVVIDIGEHIKYRIVS